MALKRVDLFDAGQIGLSVFCFLVLDMCILAGVNACSVGIMMREKVAGATEVLGAGHGSAAKDVLARTSFASRLHVATSIW